MSIEVSLLDEPHAGTSFSFVDKSDEGKSNPSDRNRIL